MEECSNFIIQLIICEIMKSNNGMKKLQLKYK